MNYDFESGHDIVCANDNGVAKEGDCYNSETDMRDLRYDNINYDNSEDGADVQPSASEICDGKDNDDNGQIDENCDFDGDGYYNPSMECPFYAFFITTINGQEKKVPCLNHKDCDDTIKTCTNDCDSFVYPDKDADDFVNYDDDLKEMECKELDNYIEYNDNADCDDEAPTCTEDCTTLFYQDSDGDGFGSDTTHRACDAPNGYVKNSEDCDDNNKNVYPNAIEKCNDDDDNCNGWTDEIWWSYPTRPLNTNQKGVCKNSQKACVSGVWVEWYDEEFTWLSYQKPQFVNIPDYSETEICDGLDNDCDGQTDEDFDIDGDGYTTCGTLSGKGIPIDSTEPQVVCDIKYDCPYYDWIDIDSEVNCPTSKDACTVSTAKCAICRYPGAEEFCDSIQTDLSLKNWNDDSICAQFKSEHDQDGDGFCNENTPTEYLSDARVCWQGAVWIAEGKIPS